MNVEAILKASPLIQMHQANEIEMFKQMWAAEKREGRPKVVVRAVRGWKCPTAADFFTEVGAAWQFPHSFGENWDAFADCVGDLAWWEADAYIFVVTRAVKFLADEPSTAWRQFADAIANAHERFSRSNRWRGPKGFRVVLQATAETGPLLRTRLKTARVNVDGPARKKK